jgi:hypothetical protein
VDPYAPGGETWLWIGGVGGFLVLSGFAHTYSKKLDGHHGGSHAVSNNDEFEQI